MNRKQANQVSKEKLCPIVQVMNKHAWNLLKTKAYAKLCFTLVFYDKASKHEANRAKTSALALGAKASRKGSAPINLGIEGRFEAVDPECR